LPTSTCSSVSSTKEYADYLRDRMRRVPGDARSRIKLGQIYTKLGRYKEAVHEFEIAARTPESRAEALHERLVANYRAGWFGEALKDGAQSLVLNPSSDRTRYWTWLAAQRSGGYPAGFPEALRAEVRSGKYRPSVELEDVATQMGLDKIGANRGTAVFDIDGDGYLDVMLASNHGGMNVYRNNGDGTFTEVTQGSGLEREVETFGVAVGDYNNDGFDDVFITRMGFYVGHSKLYRNNGDGTFTDATAEAGVGLWGPQFTAQWVDYDCDGNLDLFVCCNLGNVFDRKTPNLLFRNNGDGTFTEVSREAGLHTISPTTGAAWGDYDNDGYPDLFLSNGVGRAQLFHNNGNGTFTDVSREAGVDVLAFGGVSLWCDYDNDGWLDIVQFVWSPEPDVLYTLFHGNGPPDGHPMRIFHNNRNGTFTIKNRELGLTGCWGTMSGNVGDYNNDGNLDLMLGNGDPHMDHTQPAILLEGDATGKFKDVTFAAGLPYTGKGHGVNMADLNGDGRLCLILASGGAYPGDLLPNSVFRPKTLPGNYLNVRLVGTRSNRNAVGARVMLLAGGRTQHRLVSGGTGFGYLPYEQHFGLGPLRAANLLEILWPSGTRQSIERPPINTTIRITEGKAGWEEVYKKSRWQRVEAF